MRLLACTSIALVAAQMPGNLKQENHPSLQWSMCTAENGNCQSQQGKITVDSNWRWIHEQGQPKNCFTGNQWDPQFCPDPATCGKNCVLEGADSEYHDTYGINTQGNSMSLQFVTQGPYSKNVGSRTYLMKDDTSYNMFKLKNKEFTFTVDDSKLPCGLNGALYFVQMDEDGGTTKYPSNKAGAKYGTGYCDAQCPHDLKIINGEYNMLDWKPSATDPNAGQGKWGTCCVEMDIWEANIVSTAYTAHSCDPNACPGQTRCESPLQCGDTAPGDRFKGICDKNGCDLNTYRMGNKNFWGKGSGFPVDSSQPVQVTTQFITSDGTDTGTLTEIKRFYTQNGKKIESPTVTVGGKSHNDLSHGYCEDEANLFKDGTNFIQKGGFGAMDKAMDAGMVLVMSLWDDHEANMLWLDSTYPVPNATHKAGPGDARGTCATTSGVPKDVESQHGDAKVTFSNIRFGAIGSTSGGSPPSAPPTRVESTDDGSCKPWGGCANGGAPSCCPTGWQCTSRAQAAQCTPIPQLVEAFMATKPTAQAIEKFLANGTTVFPRSGLPA